MPQAAKKKRCYTVSFSIDRLAAFSSCSLWSWPGLAFSYSRILMKR